MTLFPWWRRVALLAAVLTIPTPGVPSLSAQEVYIRVPVELGAAATRSTLPFGEPFLLVGAAPEALRRVDARPIDLRDIDSSDPDAAEEACERRLEELDPGIREWTRSRDFKSDSFSVMLVRGLRANRRYTLCFGTRSAIVGKDLQKFRDRAFAILDTTFEKLDVADAPRSLSPANVRQLQVVLARALPSRPNDKVHTRGTLFDTTQAKPPLETLLRTGEILSAQDGRRRAAVDWDSAMNMTSGSLSALGHDRVLSRVVATLSPRDRVAGLDSATLEESVATARLLIVPDPDVVDASLRGMVVLKPAAARPAQTVGMTSLADSADVAARAARLDSTYLRLTQLRNVAAALQATPALQQRFAIRRDDAEGLRRRLEAAMGQAHGIRTALARWTSNDAERRRLLESAAGELQVEAERKVDLSATSISSFEARAKQYVTADIGMAYLPKLGEAAPYFGVNFYPGAINKRVPLGFGQRELDRWSFTLGLTATSISQKDVRDDLFSSYSLLLGTGRRMTDAIRLTGGGVLFRGRHPNPLVDDTSIAASPFLSLSFDFDARAALGRVGDVLSK